MANNTTTTTTNSSGLRFQTTLPREIITDILTQTLVEPSVCALSVLCPDWNLCRPRHVALDAILRTTRVDTYTLPTDPSTPGSVTTSFNHPQTHAHTCFSHPDPHGTYEDSRGYWCQKAHHSYRQQLKAENQNQSQNQQQQEFYLPRLRDPRPSPSEPDGGSASGFPMSYTRELVHAWASTSVVAVTQRLGGRGVVGPLWAPVAPEVVCEMVLLRDESAVVLLPFKDDFLALSEEEEAAARVHRGGVRSMRVFAVDGREKEMLPSVWGDADGGDGDDGLRYLYQRLRHLVVNTVPELASLRAEDLGMMPSTSNEQVDANLKHLRKWLNNERKASVMLSWHAMERLETLCLDLRGYSLPRDKYLDDFDVMKLASSLYGKELSLLVIAGLRSGRNYVGPDPLTLKDVESGSWDSEMRTWVDMLTSEKGDPGDVHWIDVFHSENVRVVRAINWWMIFRGALRPGGRLVFVDKEEVDSSEWTLLQPGPRHGAGLNHEQGAW